jgi:mannonate dehydratase
MLGGVPDRSEEASMRNPSRRTVLKAAGAALVAPAASGSTRRIAAQTPRRRVRDEGRDTPKISLEAGAALTTTPSADTAAAACRIRQLGVEHVLGGGGRIPWEEIRLQALRDNLKANGLTLGNLMISGFPNAIYNRPGRDADIEHVIASIRAAGRVGLQVVEYNWYAHRAMEGYFLEVGRAGAGTTGFDYERMRSATASAGRRAHRRDDVGEYRVLPESGGQPRPFPQCRRPEA